MQAQSLQFGPNSLLKKAAGRIMGVGAATISPSLKLITLLMFLPEELSFYIGDFRLSPIRLALLLLTPVLLIRFSQLLATRQRRLIFSDIMIALLGIWMILSPTVVVDLTYSLHHSAPFALEFCGSYFATRVLLSERGQAINFVTFLCHVIAIVALLGMLDALTAKPFIHDSLGRLTGYVKPYSNEYRSGIYRSMGPIDHPILFGVICAFGLLLAITSPIRAKGLTIFACGLGVLLSMSSAPIQAGVIGLGLVTFDRVLARFRSRWSVLIGTVALGIGAIYAYSNSPLGFVFEHLMFDPSSGWNRVYQWDLVGGFIANSPWFGIAFEWPEIIRKLPDLWYSAPSIDSYWLAQASIYGIPGVTLLGLSIISSAFYPASGRGVSLTMAESKLATTLGIIISLIAFLGFTVDFWGICWMFVPLLVGVRAHLAELGSQQRRARQLTTSSLTHPDRIQVNAHAQRIAADR
jgi:hypothetical protein